MNRRSRAELLESALSSRTNTRLHFYDGFEAEPRRWRRARWRSGIALRGYSLAVLEAIQADQSAAMDHQIKRAEKGHRILGMPAIYAQTFENYSVICLKRRDLPDVAWSRATTGLAASLEAESCLGGRGDRWWRELQGDGHDTQDLL